MSVVQVWKWSPYGMVVEDLSMPKSCPGRFVSLEAFTQAIEALRELTTYGIEMDDSRLDYVVAHIYRGDIERANKVLTEADGGNI